MKSESPFNLCDSPRILIFSSKAPLYDLIGHEDKVHDCDWSNPKYMVSGGSDNTVRVFKSKKANQKTK